MASLKHPSIFSNQDRLFRLIDHKIDLVQENLECLKNINKSTDNCALMYSLNKEATVIKSLLKTYYYETHK